MYIYIDYIIYLKNRLCASETEFQASEVRFIQYVKKMFYGELLAHKLVNTVRQETWEFFL